MTKLAHPDASADGGLTISYYRTVNVSIESTRAELCDSSHDYLISYRSNQIVSVQSQPKCTALVRSSSALAGAGLMAIRM